MKEQHHKSTYQVSEIFVTASHPLDGTGFLGFVITYPNGRIENVIIDYNQLNYVAIAEQIEALHKKYLQKQQV